MEGLLLPLAPRALAQGTTEASKQLPLPHAAVPDLAVLPPDVLCDICSRLDYKSFRSFQASSGSTWAAVALEDVLKRVPARRRGDWLQEAAEAADLAAVTWLVAADVEAGERLKALLLAAKCGHTPIVRFLHQVPGVTGDVRGLALLCGASHGHREIVAELAFAEGVERAHRRRAFKGAAAEGRREVVAELLPTEAVDAAGRQGAFVLAVMHGHADVVAQLYTPGLPLAHYLAAAVLNGHADVVAILMRKEGVTEKIRQEALARARALGRDSVVAVLSAGEA